jgi:hypothetical protein
VGLCIPGEVTFHHAIHEIVIPAQAGIQRARVGAPKRIFFFRASRAGLDTGFRRYDSSLLSPLYARHSILLYRARTSSTEGARS